MNTFGRMYLSHLLRHFPSKRRVAIFTRLPRGITQVMLFYEKLGGTKDQSGRRHAVAHVKLRLLLLGIIIQRSCWINTSVGP